METLANATSTMPNRSHTAHSSSSHHKRVISGSQTTDFGLSKLARSRAPPPSTAPYPPHQARQNTKSKASEKPTHSSQATPSPPITTASNFQPQSNLSTNFSNKNGSKPTLYSAPVNNAPSFSELSSSDILLSAPVTTSTSEYLVLFEQNLVKPFSFPHQEGRMTVTFPYPYLTEMTESSDGFLIQLVCWEAKNRPDDSLTDPACSWPESIRAFVDGIHVKLTQKIVQRHENPHHQGLMQVRHIGVDVAANLTAILLPRQPTNPHESQLFSTLVLETVTRADLCLCLKCNVCR